MISFEQACEILHKKFPKAYITKHRFKYNGSYYIDLSDESDNALVIDGTFKVDGKTGEVSKYNPILNGFIDITKIEIIE